MEGWDVTPFLAHARRAKHQLAAARPLATQPRRSPLAGGLGTHSNSLLILSVSPENGEPLEQSLQHPSSNESQNNPISKSSLDGEDIVSRALQLRNGSD